MVVMFGLLWIRDLEDTKYMKIHILSDLHIEYSTFEPPKVDSDVGVLSCDICKGVNQCAVFASDQHELLPVVLMPG
jgi:hypothetical protein